MADLKRSPVPRTYRVLAAVIGLLLLFIVLRAITPGNNPVRTGVLASPDTASGTLVVSPSPSPSTLATPAPSPSGLASPTAAPTGGLLPAITFTPPPSPRPAQTATAAATAKPQALSWRCMAGDYPGLDPNFCAPLPPCYYKTGKCLDYETKWYLPSKVPNPKAACADIAPAHKRTVATCLRDLSSWDWREGWGVDPVPYPSR